MRRSVPHQFLLPIFVVFGIIIPACTSKEEKRETAAVINWRDSLKVGMTYDEVEKILGKPSDILRGVTKVEDEKEKYNINDLDLAGLNRRLEELKLKKAMLDTLTNLWIWVAKKSIETSGQLMYVNWKYLGSQFDTATVLEPTWIWIKKTTLGAEYYVNGAEVSRADFDLVDKFVYHSYYNKGLILSEKEWKKRKELGLEVPEPEQAVKEIKEIPLEQFKEKLILSYSHQVVESMFTILFDASSGRVVQWGYYPVSIVGRK